MIISDAWSGGDVSDYSQAVCILLGTVQHQLFNREETKNAILVMSRESDTEEDFEKREYIWCAKAVRGHQLRTRTLHSQCNRRIIIVIIRTVIILVAKALVIMKKQYVQLMY